MNNMQYKVISTSGNAIAYFMLYFDAHEYCDQRPEYIIVPLNNIAEKTMARVEACA
jgi:hypothetical protein